MYVYVGMENKLTRPAVPIWTTTMTLLNGNSPDKRTKSGIGVGHWREGCEIRFLEAPIERIVNSIACMCVRVASARLARNV